LVFGTIDIMRGGLTGIDWSGQLVSVPGLATPQTNPFIAFLIELGHLLSDAPTKMGLPAPGWNLAPLLQFGEIGTDHLTLAQTARQMYLNGYDSRHFLTMSLSPAAAELILRGYWGIRNTVDQEFKEEVRHAARVAGTDRVGDHPRFQGISLTAHLIASAANAGKIALYQSPYAFNYSQWLMFLRALVKFSRTKFRSPTDVLIGHSEANLAALEEGWPDIELTSAAPVLPDAQDAVHSGRRRIGH
jgi:hypothetical protein